MGRYRPPDSNPLTDPFNSSSHPLGKRARKLSSHGILIVRFELPFHVFCLSCNAHLPQGRRYNAEKKQVGEYLSTKIWSFTCKCNSCSTPFEIRTDPKNSQYIVGDGAKKQNQDWDPSQHGGFPIYDSESRASQSQSQEQEEGKGADDAFSKLEKQEKLKSLSKQRAARIRELESHSSTFWSDPYTKNANVRKQFRKEKRVRTQQLANDLDLKNRIGWNPNLNLVESSPRTVEKDKELWQRHRKQHLFPTSQSSSPPPSPPSSSYSSLAPPAAAIKHRIGDGSGASNQKKSMSSAFQRLQASLVAKSRKNDDPFLSQVRSHQERPHHHHHR